ncbi:polymeric immunoglobulin receptor-like [Anas acuta]|uniref:polymeric immunoglobulin receptor-like n=1 Tax=Anas acuta TaxID=28680 RepID=UPI0035C93A23
MCLWRQDGPCSAPGHFPKRTLSCSCYSVALQNVVKDFRGKARPQALPPAASVGGRRAHPGRRVATGRVGEAMELRVVLLLPLCFPGVQAQTPGELSQREGSDLSVLCPYPKVYWELKSWCRWTDQGCQLQVAIIGTRTELYTDRARQGHITIQDDPLHKIFSITMTDLQVEDSGTYYCAYWKGRDSHVPLKRISLNVFKELHKLELDSLSVQCPYHTLGYRSERKAWCRYPGQTGRCELVVSTDTTYTRGISKGKEGRASIQDDTQKRTVTITMEKLQAQDSGVYWCALYTPYATTHFTRIMEFQLSVAKRRVATTLSGTGQNYLPGNSTQAGLWSFTLCALLGFFINKVLVILLLVFLQRRGRCRKEKLRTAEGSPGQLPEEERILSCSCYSVLLQNMVKDFRGKARPQELPPSASVGGRRVHPGRRVATEHIGEAMELRVVLLLPLCFPGSQPTTALHQLPSPSPLLVFSGLQAQTIQKLSQREGSNLSVLCHYPAEDAYREMKSWCRWTDQRCQLQVATSGTRTHFYTYRARQGHFTIKDDPIHKNFSITMTDLQVEDSGTYYCAYSQSYVLLKRISLNVFKEFHKLELDSLSVQCPYHTLGYRSERKAWCRGVGQTGRCDLVVSTDTTYRRGISKGKEGRASIQDDTQNTTVTITMEKLQAQDSGVYWCALYTPNATINFTPIMEVRLSVAKRRVATTLSGTGQNYLPGNSTQAGLWSFTLQALLGFFINKVLVILLLIFLQRRGHWPPSFFQKCRAAEGSPGQLPEEERS